LVQSQGTFTPTGDLAIPRARHRATLLLDGRLLIAGGVAPGVPLGLASAELYDIFLYDKAAIPPLPISDWIW
jgi:hypothetical protein